jgi:hypothetical protein
MMVLTLSTMAEIASNAASVATHCFQRRASDYNQFLECNFDGSTNSPGSLAQIFLASKSNNEVYTLKEMLLEPDRAKFIEAMEKEVRSMFEEEIIEVVPKQQMYDHYNKV